MPSDIQVTNIKANDGTAGLVIADSTGAVTTGQNLAVGGTLTSGSVGSAVTMSADQSCVKTALNASGSAPIYACRAFGRAGTGGEHSNFVGQNLSYSKSSATHAFTFTTAPSNDDYTVASSAGRYGSYNYLVCLTSKSASAFSLILSDIDGAQQSDAAEGVDVAVFF